MKIFLPDASRSGYLQEALRGPYRRPDGLTQIYPRDAQNVLKTPLTMPRIFMNNRFQNLRDQTNHICLNCGSTCGHKQVNGKPAQKRTYILYQTQLFVKVNRFRESGRALPGSGSCQCATYILPMECTCPATICEMAV